jgi:hypothetical protein
MIRATTLLSLCLVLSACQSFYPVRVQVLDAETHQPIPGATVDGNYMTELSVADVYGELIFGYTAGPKPTSATTDDHGFAVLSLSDYSARTRGALAHAPGYLTSAANIDPARFDLIRRDAHRAGSLSPAGPPDLTVHLYLGPHPKLQLVLPDGYLGLLRLDQSLPTTRATLPPHERTVEFAIHPPVPQKVPLYSVGERIAVTSRHFTARYANGIPIPSDSQDHVADDRIALRSIARYNGRAIFVVGTAGDAKTVRAQVNDLFTDFDKLWNAPVPVAN